jgi:hypothetical protein
LPNARSAAELQVVLQLAFQIVFTLPAPHP